MKHFKKIGYAAATILFLIFTLGPFIWTFLMSITPDKMMFAATTNLLPESITWSNYESLITGTRKGDMYFTSLANSMRAVGISMIVGIPVAMMSAYALSKMEFKGRILIKNMLLITMVIPVMATIIP